jgi:hypothetical protein
VAFTSIGRASALATGYRSAMWRVFSAVRLPSTVCLAGLLMHALACTDPRIVPSGDDSGPGDAGPMPDAAQPPDSGLPDAGPAGPEIEVDASACEELGCDEHARCFRRGDELTCRCPDGLQPVPSLDPDGKTALELRCEDIDECKSGTACVGGARCQNVFGSHFCRCPEGLVANLAGRCVLPSECVGAEEQWTVSVLVSGEGNREGASEVRIESERCVYRCTSYDHACVELALPPRARLRVSALPVHGRKVREVKWVDDACTPREDGSCELSLQSSLLDVVFEPAHNLAFVTSERHGVGFGGQDGASALCAEAAMNVEHPGERWIAYLRDGDASSLVGLNGSRGWTRVDGLPLFDEAPHPEGNLPHGSVSSLFALNVDESAQTVPGPYDQSRAWLSSSDCASLTSASPDEHTNAGIVHAPLSYLAHDERPCSGKYHLYCFGTGKVAPLPQTPRFVGPIAFVTRARFSLQASASTALERADSLCQREACRMGFTGVSDASSCDSDPGAFRRFRALLGTSTVAASSRFDSLAGPWLNYLRLPWVPAEGTVTEGPWLSEVERPYFGVEDVLVGFENPDVVSTKTCADWTSGSATGLRWNRRDLRSFSVSEQACGNGPLLCLEVPASEASSGSSRARDQALLQPSSAPSQWRSASDSESKTVPSSAR